MRFLLFAWLGLLLTGSAFATTWDEPWHEQVVKKADYFVLVKIKATDEQHGISATVIRTLAGGSLTGDIKITDFYLLNMCSSSGGHGPEFQMGNTDSCYFFLQKNAAGNYSMATPSTGFAVMDPP